MIVLEGRNLFPLLLNHIRMVKIGPIEVETGYGLMFIGGFAIWLGVPVLNSIFEIGVMTGSVSIPILGTAPVYAALGGGIGLTGFVSYLGHLFDWW